MTSPVEPAFMKILDSLSIEDKEFLQRAYDLSFKAHDGQLRKSGEIFFIHPLAVGLSLWHKFRDVELTAAGLLHDAVEDCEWLEIDVIYKEFGQRVGYIVDSVTKTENHFYGEADEFDDERDKIFAGGMSKIGCILVKLADREHNLATLKHMPAHKQVKKSFESQSLYIPLMHIIGYNDEHCSLERCEKKFHQYIQENAIRSFKTMKNNLLNICFKDFTEELFNIVYDNTTTIVWELEDKAFFNELLEKGWFDSEDVDVISMSCDLKEFFRVQFKVKVGHSFQGLKNVILSNNTYIID